MSMPPPSQVQFYYNIIYTAVQSCTDTLNEGPVRSLIHVLMRDEKEERKKQARSNKQTRQSNTAHPRQSLFQRKIIYRVSYRILLGGGGGDLLKQRN